MKEKPNLFIVGAPKCGTTSLTSYLKTHPDIFVPEIKEPHYFADDFDNFRNIRSINQYRELYKNVADEKYLCDASVWYLYSKIALSNIRDFNRNARIIVLLRNPISMLPSLHQQLFYTLDEDIPDFTTAWNLQKQRQNGKNIPPKCREKSFLQYAKVVNYTDQVNRVLYYFPKKNVKVILFDEFAENPSKVYNQILDFLNLEHDGRTYFPKMNTRKTYRSKFINKIVNRPPKFAEISANFLKKIFKVNQLNLLKNLGKLNRKQILKMELDEHTKQDIILTLQPSLIRLEKIIGRDLNHWYEYPL